MDRLNDLVKIIVKLIKETEKVHLWVYRYFSQK